MKNVYTSECLYFDFELEIIDFYKNRNYLK